MIKLDNRGLSLTQLLVAMGLSGVALTVGMTLFQANSIFSFRLRQNMEVTGLNIQISRNLIDDAMIDRSILALPSIKNCLNGTSPCPKKEYDLDIIGEGGKLINSNSDNIGYDVDGVACDLAAKDKAGCIFKVKYYYSVVCGPTQCGQLDLDIRAHVLLPKGYGGDQSQNTFNRFYSVNTAVVPTTVTPGLSATSWTFYYLKPNGEVKSFGANLHQAITTAMPDGAFVATPQVIVDSSNVPIRAKHVGHGGSGHNHLIRDDGTVWATGSNVEGDLGIGGTVASYETMYSLISTLDASGQVDIASGPASTAFATGRVSPDNFLSWHPLGGFLSDPTVAKFERAYLTSSGFSLFIRENGEVYGAGLNKFNKMGFVVEKYGASPVPTYVNPYGATVNYQTYRENFNPPIVEETATAAQLTALAVLRSGEARFKGEGNAAHYPDFDSTNPAQNDGTPGKAPEVPGFAVTPQKSFYLGTDVGFTLKKAAFRSNGGCAINQHDNAVCWGEGRDGSLGRGQLEKDIADDIADPLVPGLWAPGSKIPRILKYIAIINYSRTTPVSGNPRWTIGRFTSPWNTGLPDELPDPTGAKNSFHSVVDIAGVPVEGVKEISGFGEHICMIDSVDQVRCWGKNNYGQLGRGFTCNFIWGNVRSFSPDCQKVDRAGVVLTSAGVPLTGVVKIQVADYRSLALTDTGELYAWGYQGVVESFLGISALATPRGFRYATKITHVPGKIEDFATNSASHSSRTCALNDSGELWCWGANKTRFGNFVFVDGGPDAYRTAILVNSNFTD